MTEYEAMRKILAQQKQAAEELIASGNLQAPEWIRSNIDVESDDEAIREDVYGWINRYAETPEGRLNLAHALVNKTGGNNKMSVKFAPRTALETGLTGGAGSAILRRISLGAGNWDANKEWNANYCLPHEIRHVGQQNIHNMSQREYVLYHSLVVEADARLMEFCDGITEGRNPGHNGFLGLDGNLKQAVKDLKASNVKSWEDFDALKTSDRARYDQIMGRIKEQEFSEVLNNLGKNPVYQLQGYDSWAQMNGKLGSNLGAIQACVEEMCERQGMRFEQVWPEVEAMAMGKKEIPGWEGAFDKDGMVTTLFEQKISELNTIMNRDIVAGTQSGSKKMRIFADGERESIDYYDTGEWKEKENVFADGSSTKCCYDKNGNVTRRECTAENMHDVTDYEYDDNDRMLKSKTKFLDGSEETTEFEYNADGQLKRNVTNSSNGSQIIREFDQNGLSKITEYDSNGNSVVKQFENYKKVKEEQYDKNGKLLKNSSADNKTKKGSVKQSTSDDQKDTSKTKRQIDNGKGLDNKLQDAQQTQERQYGNGKGLNDALGQAQELAEKTQQNDVPSFENTMVSVVQNSGRE